MEREEGERKERMRRRGREGRGGCEGDGKRHRREVKIFSNINGLSYSYSFRNGSSGDPHVKLPLTTDTASSPSNKKTRVW